MRNCFLSFIFLFCALQLQAQTKINRYEYWFDNNFNAKVVTSVSPAAIDYTLNSSINTSSLKAGLHTFNIRFRDNASNYSEIKTNHFYKSSGLITSYEFWFDGNYKGKIIQTLAPSAIVNIPATINAGSLKAGLHQFNIRFQGNDSTWSGITSKYFYQQSRRIKGYEYWFDNNYSEKVSINVTPSQTFNLTDAIYTDNLKSGYHTFNIRFKDLDNLWSTIENNNFLKLGSSGIGNALTAYRYWFDAGDTILVNKRINGNSDLLLLNDSINSISLSAGFHKIHFQVKDTVQLWSSVISYDFRKIGIPRVDNISPNYGGNIGYVTANIFGDGFYDDTKVILVSATDSIRAVDSLSTNFSGYKLAATFNLKGKTVGKYDVVVHIFSPKDTVLIIRDGFEILNGIYIPPTVEVTGESSGRENVWSLNNLVITNNGNVNCYMTPIWLGIPAKIKFEIGFDFAKPNTPGLSYDTIPIYFETDTLFGEPLQESNNVFPIIIPIIQPNQTITLPFKTQPTSSGNYCITSLSNSDYYRFDLVKLFLDCMIGLGENFLSPPGKDCLDNFNPDDKELSEFEKRNKVLNSIFQVTDYLSCIPKLNKILEKIKDISGATKSAINNYETYNDCNNFLHYNDNKKCKQVSVRFSRDPNEKFGPVSLDTIRKFVSNGSPLNYNIQFENDSAATASAKTITIIDSLNTSVFNTSTFSFGNISIGEAIINIPPGLKSYSTNFDLSAYGTAYVCKVNAGINLSSGVITWNFQTLDPYTLSPVNIPTAGILPPNTISPKGQGNVTYSVKALNNLSLNTSIDNKAYIVFDNNPVIKTGTWHNSLDNIKPQSSIRSLPPVKNDTIFNINWSGSDIGSGILNYNIYCSTNGGAYKILVNNIRDTSYIFHGQADSIYAFYSIASDSAFNKEEAPLFADATTQIKLLSISGAVTNVLCNGNATGSIIISVTGATSSITYNWSNGATTTNISGLVAGNYTLTVTVASGNVLSKSFLITQPNIISATKTLVNEIPVGAHNGSATVVAHGGKSPYNYLWSNGSTSNAISGLSAGTYTVTITDFNNCIKSIKCIITNNARLSSEEENLSDSEWTMIIEKEKESNFYSVIISGLKNNATLIICDAIGKEIYKDFINSSAGININHQIPVMLKNQFYLLTIDDGKDSRTIKFLGE